MSFKSWDLADSRDSIWDLASARFSSADASVELHSASSETLASYCFLGILPMAWASTQANSRIPADSGQMIFFIGGSLFSSLPSIAQAFDQEKRQAGLLHLVLHGP